MSTPVTQFIRDSHKLYNVKYALTNERLRKLRYQLRMADIVDVVEESDTPLALDIILAGYNKSSSTLRTAAVGTPFTNGVPQLKSAGMCPRCSSSMQFAKIANSSDIRYCASCHVCAY